MRISLRTLVAIVLLTVAAQAQGASISKPPDAPKRPVTDEYQGVKVTDDYRWLEDAREPEVAAWVAAQNQLTRSRLDALPDRPRIRARIAELLSPSMTNLLSREPAAVGQRLRTGA